MVAFPMLSDDVGNWTEPLGLVSISAEFIALVCALTQSRRADNYLVVTWS
jgi:hypothetical protein